MENWVINEPAFGIDGILLSELPILVCHNLFASLGNSLLYLASQFLANSRVLSTAVDFTVFVDVDVLHG